MINASHFDALPHQLAWRNREAQRVAHQLGLAPAPIVSGPEQLPINLCQRRVAAERQLADARLIDFIKARSAGSEVVFVTVCKPEWTCAGGQLSTLVIAEARAWMSRRARSLARYGHQRMLGFIDIAWNDRSAVGGTSHWSIHVHCLIFVEGRARCRELVAKAFACRSDGDRVLKPVVRKYPATRADLSRVSFYNSRSLLLHHNQRRQSYINSRGVACVRDTKLRTYEILELATVVNHLGPQAFWVLSGYRRKQGAIHLHNQRS